MENRMVVTALRTATATNTVNRTTRLNKDRSLSRTLTAADFHPTTPGADSEPAEPCIVRRVAERLTANSNSSSVKLVSDGLPSSGPDDGALRRPRPGSLLDGPLGRLGAARLLDGGGARRGQSGGHQHRPTRRPFRAQRPLDGGLRGARRACPARRRAPGARARHARAFPGRCEIG